jgi:hypothetical protein
MEFGSGNVTGIFASESGGFVARVAAGVAAGGVDERGAAGLGVARAALSTLGGATGSTGASSASITDATSFTGFCSGTAAGSGDEHANRNPDSNRGKTTLG